MKNKTQRLILMALAVVAMFVPTSSKADSLLTFVYRTCQWVPDMGGLCPAGAPVVHTYTWQAPSTPAVTTVSDTFALQEFTIATVLTVDGVLFGPVIIDYFNQVPTEMVQSFGFSNLAIGGSAISLWTGTATSPTFDLRGGGVIFEGPEVSPQSGTLEVTDAPEPATLTLLSAGLLVLIWKIQRSANRELSPG